jgi:hypothetical protein
MTTAAAAVSKQHDRASALRQVQVAVYRHRADSDTDQPLFSPEFCRSDHWTTSLLEGNFTRTYISASV